MKIAVTAREPKLELASEVDPRFGRARCFLIFDTETEEMHVLDNEQNLNAAQGAGIQAAQTVSESDPEAVVTGNVGPRAFATLNCAGIRVYIGAKSTVADAIEAAKAGKLQTAGGANVEGHWT